MKIENNIFAIVCMIKTIWKHFAYPIKVSCRISSNAPKLLKTLDSISHIKNVAYIIFLRRHLYIMTEKESTFTNGYFLAR